MSSNFDTRRHADTDRGASISHRPDHRYPAERDRDRILYSNAFQRLSGVSQVASPAEGQVIHNRLTHSLKVAQIARRLAEKLNRRTDPDILHIQKPDPDVAEAAALAHDLGHPPFGHVGEEELHRLVNENDNESDGYEGNPQSFRIVTRLAVRSLDHIGLDLTRGTLNALLKYPTLKSNPNQRKWGAYREDIEDFEWARHYLTDGITTIEAQIMDWADDITYALHDVEDFYKAGFIPINLIIHDKYEKERFLESVQRRWDKLGRIYSSDWPKYVEALDRGRDYADLVIRGSYEGSQSQQARIREFSNTLISRYINRTTMEPRPSGDDIQLIIPDDIRYEVDILKELNGTYVIQSPALLTQQKGYRLIIVTLFDLFLKDRNEDLVPPTIKGQMSDDASSARRSADIVSALSDQQAVRLFNRVTGSAPGSIRDLI